MFGQEVTVEYCVSYFAATVFGIVLYVCNRGTFRSSMVCTQGLLPAAPPEEAPCGLEHLPDSIELALHIFELKQVAQDELILSHGLLADNNAQWPLNLQASNQLLIGSDHSPFASTSQAELSPS